MNIYNTNLVNVLSVISYVNILQSFFDKRIRRVDKTKSSNVTSTVSKFS